MAEKKGLPQTGGKGGKDDNGKNEKPDKKFFENLFAPLKESVSNFANTIREQGGSQVSEGFKQLGLTSGPLGAVLGDMVEKIQGLGNVLAGSFKLISSPFKAMGNAIFGSKEDTEDSNEDLEEAKDENTEKIKEHTEALDENIKNRKKTDKKETKHRKGMMGGLARFAPMLIFIIGGILLLFAAFKAEAFAALGVIGREIGERAAALGQSLKTAFDDVVTKTKNFGAKIAQGADDLVTSLKNRFPNATKTVSDLATKGKDLVKTGVQKAGNFFSNAFQGAKNFVSSAGEKIAGGANYVKEKFAKAGKFVANAGKTALKRLPLIGGAIESFMDAKDNKAAYENLKAAYQDGTEVPKADGSLGPITDEEWAEIDKQYKASIAGSVAKGAGSTAAGTGAAVLAAPLLALGPLGWLAYGVTVVGASIVGGKAADTVATNMAEGMIDADDSMVDFDTLASQVPDTSNAIKQATDDVVAVSETATGGESGSAVVVQQNNNSSGTQVYGNSPSVDDSGLNASYAT